MHRRADIVLESGKRELGGANAAADRVGGLENAHRVPGTSEGDRGGEPVGSAADDGRASVMPQCPTGAHAA